MPKSNAELEIELYNLTKRYEALWTAANTLRCHVNYLNIHYPDTQKHSPSYLQNTTDALIDTIDSANNLWEIKNNRLIMKTPPLPAPVPT